jgi:hypothetical protein
MYTKITSRRPSEDHIRQLGARVRKVFLSQLSIKAVQFHDSGLRLECLPSDCYDKVRGCRDLEASESGMTDCGFLHVRMGFPDPGHPLLGDMITVSVRVVHAPRGARRTTNTKNSLPF